MIVVTGVLLITGSILIFISSLGLIRMPGFYTRIHAAGKTDTLGQILILLGLILYKGFSLISVKLLFILAFVFIANPTATHALAQAAYRMGVPWWRKKYDSDN
ncbi:MAG: cation:proton antiporter [Calditerrivibrio nitroreducens]|uniref:Cation:proton antiporter n=1 Tax=Calditerrivibrio nitroreducens TaxID=477976 RepID=A0A2J6WI73_9BACT|nr:MAG: cation:proton antiporter [Calditerrivibrio nitroreducens]